VVTELPDLLRIQTVGMAGKIRAELTAVGTHNLREFQRVPNLKLEDWF
jgi:predicted nucleic acid-binding protein